MISPIVFDIPLRQEPEAGLPETVMHECDYDFIEPGKLMYYYNFIDYVWKSGDLTVTGRSYREDPREIMLSVERERLSDDPLLQPILLFLQRRFRVIRTMSQTEGYVLSFLHSSMKDEDV